MTERLALAVIPGVGWSAAETQAIAREAEAAGFDAIFAAEVNNDVMATAQADGRGDQPHPGGDLDRQYLPAPLLHLRARGSPHRRRHRRALHPRARGQPPADQPSARDRHAPPAGDPAPLRHRGARLAAWRGAGDPPAAAAGRRNRCRSTWPRWESRRSNWAGSWPTGSCRCSGRRSGVAQSKAWAARGRANAPELGPLDVTLGLPTFIGDDLAALREAARQNLVLYTGLPFFQRLFRDMGFADEAALMERGDGMAGLSDRLLDGDLPDWPDRALSGAAGRISRGRGRPADPLPADRGRRGAAGDRGVSAVATSVVVGFWSVAMARPTCRGAPTGRNPASLQNAKPLAEDQTRYRPGDATANSSARASASAMARLVESPLPASQACSNDASPRCSTSACLVCSLSAGVTP